VGIHALAIYPNKKSKMTEAFRFLREGFEAGEAVLFISEDMSKEEIRQQILKEWNIADSSIYENSCEILISTTKEWYFPDGDPDIGRIIAKWHSTIFNAISRGKRGLRIFGDAKGFFNHGQIDALLDYELTLTKVFDLEVTALCAYEAADLKRLSSKQMADLSSHHLLIHLGSSDYTNLKAFGRIMIVDDEPDIGLFLEEGLELRQFSVDVFTDSKEALIHLQHNLGRYKVVISDIRMPGMTGVDLLEKMKRIDPDIKFILMTAHDIDQSQFANIPLHLSADLILQKPFDLNMLWSSVLKLLIQSAAQLQHRK
jgi:CheY-like chemotaxis protein